MISAGENVSLNFNVFDGDLGENGTVTFSISSGNILDVFEIKSVNKNQVKFAISNKTPVVFIN